MKLSPPEILRLSLRSLDKHFTQRRRKEEERKKASRKDAKAQRKKEGS